MKFVHSLQGATAIHVATDEVVPEGGMNSHDLIKIVGENYSFAVRPEIPPGMLPAIFLPYVFQAGSATIGDKKYPIYQLIILQQGDIVNAANTDFSDIILKDYTEHLDAALGYRFAQVKNKRITHQSHVVVDFDVDIGTSLAALKKIEELLDGSLKTPGAPFRLKRIAFGSGPVIPQGTPITLQAFESIDFLIERRVGEIDIKNRYYSAAPLTTSEHLHLLGTIERQLG